MLHSRLQPRERHACNLLIALAVRMEPLRLLMRITPNYKAGAGIALHGINLLDRAAICNPAVLQ